MGLLPFNIPGLTMDNAGGDMPNGADYCGFTDGQILDMIETLVDKNLNEQVGLGYVDALNMKACGSDTWTISSVRTDYTVMYSDYYLYAEQSTTGSGWNGLLMGWTNSRNHTDATFGKSMIVGSGTTVKELYGYNTIVISGSGTIAFFMGFAMFLRAS